jgi:transposase
MPAPDARLRPELVLPRDPAGVPEPHDVLAAEEFAMPAPDAGSGAQAARKATAPGRPRLAGLAGAGLLAYWVRRRRR